MTHTENTIVIDAPAATIYHFAAATERWPMYLPHYRYVHVLEQRGNTRVVEMGASRSGIPISWVAEQTNDPVRPCDHLSPHPRLDARNGGRVALRAARLEARLA